MGAYKLGNLLFLTEKLITDSEAKGIDGSHVLWMKIYEKYLEILEEVEAVKNSILKLDGSIPVDLELAGRFKGELELDLNYQAARVERAKCHCCKVY